MERRGANYGRRYDYEPQGRNLTFSDQELCRIQKENRALEKRIWNIKPFYGADVSLPRDVKDHSRQKFTFSDQELCRIQKENLALEKRIRNTKPFYTADASGAKSYKDFSCNFTFSDQELYRIHRENQALEKRLTNIKPFYRDDIWAPRDKLKPKRKMAAKTQ